MRPKTPEPSGSGDLFRARLDQIVNMRHELVCLSDEIDWAWVDEQLDTAIYPTFFQDWGAESGFGGDLGLQ